MSKYKCLIVEDEPLAQRIIEKYLQEYDQFELVKTCNNVLHAFEIINSEQVDMLFLDINLPGINGIDFISSLKAPPAVIFTTAYSEYAVNSYELEAVDYLLKPITPERFRRCINKILRLQDAPEKEKVSPHIFIKVNGKLVKILLDAILYIEARKDYLMIHLKEKCYLTHMTMKAMEGLLTSEQFQRVHRSYIVNINSIFSLSPTQLEIENTAIPVGEKYKKAVGAKFKKVKNKN